MTTSSTAPASVAAGGSRASHGAPPPGLVLVSEPDELGVERAHPQLAFGVRLVELAEPNRHVAADDDRPPAVSTTTTWCPSVCPGAGNRRIPGSTSATPSCST